MEGLGGKVAVVTGASAGIGAAVCKALVQEAHMVVIGVARRHEKIKDTANTLKCKNGKLIAYRCDLTCDDEVEKLFKWVAENHGPVQVLINNAGMLSPTSLLEGNPKSWRKVMDLNVIAQCLCTNLAIKSMEDAKINGQIINITSRLAHQIRDEGPSHFYSGTKFALRAITDSYRLELKQRNSGIRISAISPGLVNTEVFADIRSKFQDLDHIPMLEPEDIADSVLGILRQPQRSEVQDVIIIPTYNLK